ncbi:TPA: hypothetical protein ACFN68_002022, partial [Neisseria meningitidis]
FSPNSPVFNGEAAGAEGSGLAGAGFDAPGTVGVGLTLGASPPPELQAERARPQAMASALNLNDEFDITFS